MGTEPGNPPAKAGALLLRVWLEDSADPELRIRLVGRLNLDAHDGDSAAVTSIEETLAYVRSWLERFAASGQG